MADRPSTDTLRDRIGIALRIDHDIPERLAWAGEHGLRYVDFHLDDRGPDPEAYPEEEVAAIRDAAEEHDLSFGLHALSAVNVAETEPIVSGAVEDYLLGYVDLAAHLGASYVVHHGGYHFTTDHEERLAVSIDRLDRAGAAGARHGVRVVMCNMNPEPPRSEIQLLGSSLEECRRYEDALPAEHVGWSFNAPHAHLTEDGIEGFLEGLDVDRIDLVRLNDNRGVEEEHLRIGEGTIDFRATVAGLEGAGFDGHYIIAYGSNEDMLEERERLLEIL